MDARTLEERLISNLESGRLAHAYILEGPRKVTEPVARLFAKAILCTGEGKKPCGSCASCRNIQNGIYEDLILLEGTSSGKSGNRSLKDDQVEAMQDSLKKKPLASERIVALIADADLLTERAQNRLLKTLEEPPGRDALILLSENTEHLLPTILSRCQVLKTGGESEDGEAVTREYAKTYLKHVLAGSAYYEFLPVLRKVTEDKPTADAFLDSLEELLSEAVKDRAEGKAERALTPDSAKAFSEMVYAVEEARKDLGRNVNVGYALKDLTLKMI